MKKPSKSTMKNKLDKICSLLVRKRGHCQRCDMIDYEKLQWSHIYGRKYHNVRWDLNNALCLCASCHFWWHDNPTHTEDLVVRILGEYEYTQLRMRRTSTKRWTVPEMQELHKELTNLYEST